MIKQNRQRALLGIWIVALLFAGLACNFITQRFAATTPTPTLPNPTEAVEQLATDAAGSLQDFTQNGHFELTVTEGQLTSVIVSELSKQPDPLITNPQVGLQDGQIKVTGQVKQSGFSLPAEIIVQPKIGANGEPYVELISLSVGPFDVSQSMRDQVTSIINNMLIEQLTGSDSSVQLDSITIADGVMTVSGSRR